MTDYQSKAFQEEHNDGYRKNAENKLKNLNKNRQWDGRSRPTNDSYAKNWNDIFGKKKKDLLRSI